MGDGATGKEKMLTAPERERDKLNEQAEEGG